MEANAERPCKTVAAPGLQPVLQMGRAQLVSAQRTDPSLACCIESVTNFKNKLPDKVKYFWEGDVLMCRWRPNARSSLNEVHQIILPQQYWKPVLRVAHEHALSGHLVVTKSFKRVPRYFYWPGLKSAVSKF